MNAPTGTEIVPQFQFTRFAVNRVLFEHGPRVPRAEGETQPERIFYNLVIGAGFRMFPNKTAEVSLGTTVTADPKWCPYKVEVEVLGRFSTENGTVEDLEQFCRLGAPPILFPYIREIVHRLTADGKYGAIKLDPINIQHLLNTAEWSDSPAKSTASEP